MIKSLVCDKSVNKKQKKKVKWKNATQELALFHVKPNQEYNSIESDYCSIDFEELIEDNQLSNEDNFNFELDYDEFGFKYLLRNNRIRQKKSHKKIKLKFLVKNNDIQSLLLKIKDKDQNLKNLDFISNSLIKGQSKLHVKYHVYKELQPMLDFIYEYNYKSQMNNKTLTKEELNYLKRIPARWIETPTRKNHNSKNKPVLVEYTLDHNQVTDEMKDNYDSMYIEFLMSLQHREISPEDYEYLSRLDDLVKKKTVNENALKKLKTELVTNELLPTIENEVCTICFDPYVLNQKRKYLPCNHVFHDECITNWLQNNSNKCPLDQLTIEI